MQSTHHGQLRRKRDAYRRSKTVAVLAASPTHGIPQQQQQQQQSIELASSTAPSQSQPMLWRSSSRSSRGSVGSSSVDQQPRQTPPPLLQRTASKPASSHRRLLGRTPSSPSMLLSRVRELIREKVVETTVDRTDLAAMERERRQRAADAFVESLHRRQQQQQQQHHEHRHSSGSVDAATAPSVLARRSVVRKHRTRSDPASSRLRRCSLNPEMTTTGEIPLQAIGGAPPPPANVAKSAFREYRSTSEDTSSRRHSSIVVMGTTRRMSHDIALSHRGKG